MDASRPAAAGLPGGADSPPVVLKGRFEITQDMLRDPIGSPRTPAHAARDRLNRDHQIFALVCDPELPQHLTAMDRLKDHPSRVMLRLLDYGIVPWPETGDHRVVLIFAMPSGPRLVPSLESTFEPLSELEIVNRVMAPVTAALEELYEVGVTHGALRPTNIFLPRDKKSFAMLGECISSPPHLHQPMSFVPIEMAQALPAGRGIGDVTDDIYAMGVTVLSLLMGSDPGIGMDPQQLLEQKIARGSFNALSGQFRIPAVLREPLRGMLEDRSDLRWTLADLRSWLSERRLKAPHHAHTDKAQRALTLSGMQFHFTRPLAHHIATQWETLRLEDKGHEVLNWARRALGDDSIGDAVLMAMEQGDRNSESGDGTINATFAARLAMALDRQSPIRYRGVGANIDGFGPLIAIHYHDTEVLRAASEMLMADLPTFRQRTQDEETQDKKPQTMRILAQMARNLKNPNLGFGIERCLYELNPLQYCRSPLIEKQKVMSITDLLPALEKIAGRGQQGPPFDRHIAAYIATHLRVELQALMNMASEQKDPERQALGMLGVLGTLQAQAGGQSFPGVTRWLGKYLRPLVDSYRHRMWREKVENELPALLDRGDITALYIYLANGEARQRDRNGFAEAVAEYARLSAEIAYLKSFGFNDPRRTEEYGRQISAGLTGLISLAAIIFSMILAW